MWPLIAGGLLLWYEAGIGRKRYASLFLFASGVATGWSVVVRQTSGLLALVLVGFLLWLLFCPEKPTLSGRLRFAPWLGF